MPKQLQASARAKALIGEFEGFGEVLPDGRVKAYPDPASGGVPWTIGFGSTGKNIGPGTIWTVGQCEAAFDADIAKFAAGVNRLLARGNVGTTQGQFDALVSFAYNCGLDENRNGIAEGLGDSTLLRKHLAGDFAGAAVEFEKWNKAAGKVMAGLTRRRKAEAALYRGG